MATFTAFDALDMRDLGITIDAESTVAIQTSTQLRIVSDDQVTDVFGTAFTYDAQSRFTGGTITRIDQSDGGDPQFRLEGSYSAVTVAGFLDQGAAGADGLRAFLLAGSDTVTGSSGSDVLIGLSGADRLEGGAGNDVLDGGTSGDTMLGGTGNDTYLVNISSDVVTEASGAGTDTVRSTISYTLGANVERLTMLGSAALNGTGNSLSNVLTGNSGANRLSGGSGNDTLNGGAGNDTMLGGTGNDTYVVNASGDVVTEASGAGTDTVQSSISYTLGANLERLTLLGSAALNGTGNALSNVLTGNSGANRLSGGSGNDTLNGGGGNDTMIGGTSNDTYVVNATGDVVTEASGAGTDTVQSSISYTLGSNLEKLTLIGSAAINGAGNSLNNVLTGNSAANRLSGGSGSDTMVGGAGNDTYVVNSSGDVVTEASGGGTDTVQSSISYTLGANVERLTLLGSAALNGTGNALSNVLIGNSAANRLSGGSGNDILNGGTGNDTMLGGVGNDTYVVNASGDVVTEAAGAGTDTVQSSISYTLGANLERLTLLGSAALNGTGNALSNVLIGNSGANRLSSGSGNDTLNGGGGNDTMLGGTSNDTYVVNATGDVVTEASGAGTDTVQSSISYTLGSNLEKLTLIGSAAINGAGNSLNNVLTGNSAANRLSGGSGSDTMVGGAGNDTYVVNSTGDVVAESTGRGTDTVQSSISYTLGANVERLTLLGSAALDGTGNTLSNLLVGNGAANHLSGGAGNDTLNGGAGNDTMLGGAGNDTYVVNASGDVVTEASGAGTDTVQSSISYTLGANLENLTLIGSAAINGTGNALSNVLTGNSAANRLSGGSGSDTLNGGGGNDTMLGGTSNDTYVVNATGDVVTESSGAGTDTVQSSISYTLGANLEKLTLIGSAAINGTGNSLSNVLTGNSAANRLSGGSGSDTLNGGGGNDTMLGGLGNDTFVVNSSHDVVSESSGGGTDTVQSSVSYTLGSNLERLTLLGSASINGNGNSLSNLLTGNDGINKLSGGAGNDIIDGGAGGDSMIGGAGNDTYVVDSFNDIVTETGTSASEIDTVRSSVNHTLAANVERLTLTGSANITGTGNQGNNVLTGNSGTNLLKGSGGNDSINGGAGDDNIDGGAGRDDLTGGDGQDHFIFASALNASTNVDRVVDFVAADDDFRLDNGIFLNSGVAFGQLGANAFHVGTAAADASDRVIFDQASGELFYDADGTGGDAQILFAHVDAGTNLTVNDFFIT